MSRWHWLDCHCQCSWCLSAIDYLCIEPFPLLSSLQPLIYLHFPYPLSMFHFLITVVLLSFFVVLVVLRITWLKWHYCLLLAFIKCSSWSPKSGERELIVIVRQHLQPNCLATVAVLLLLARISGASHFWGTVCFKSAQCSSAWQYKLFSSSVPCL